MKKELYLEKLELMKTEGKNIPFTTLEVKSLPLGFTETTLYFTRKQLNKLKK